MAVLQKAIAYLVLIVTLLGLGYLGIRQYGNARVSAQELGTVKQAVSEAVAERKAALAVDVSQAKQNSVVRDSVRAVLVQARKKDAETLVKNPVLPDCDAGDAGRLRLLNDAIGEVNRNVQRAGELPH